MANREYIFQISLNNIIEAINSMPDGYWIVLAWMGISTFFLILWMKGAREYDEEIKPELENIDEFHNSNEADQ